VNQSSRREGSHIEDEASKPTTTLRTRVLLWLAWWVVFFIAWMSLVGVLVGSEIIAGIGAAAVAATVAELVRVQDARQFRPRLRWILRAWRLPLAAVRDCRVVLGVLWRHVIRGEEGGGAFRAFHFPVAGTGGRAAGRRALLNAAISFTPNTYVVGIDEEKEQVLVHQLVPSPRQLVREDVIGKL
jgi:multisubunit Na+/H+ antiporter MnhE subunit